MDFEKIKGIFMAFFGFLKTLLANVGFDKFGPYEEDIQNIVNAVENATKKD